MFDVDFLLIFILIVVCKPAGDGGVIRVLYILGIAVVSVQREQEGSEHTALGGSLVLSTKVEDV